MRRRGTAVFTSGDYVIRGDVEAVIAGGVCRFYISGKGPDWVRSYALVCAQGAKKEKYSGPVFQTTTTEVDPDTYAGTWIEPPHTWKFQILLEP